MSDNQLPSVMHYNDEIFVLHQGLKGIIKGVHFYRHKTKYDIELRLDWNEIGETVSTRIYNVDSKYVSKLQSDLPKL